MGRQDNKKFRIFLNKKFKIHLKCKNKKKKEIEKIFKSIKEKYGLNREAFSIWKMYYEIIGNSTMNNILEIVKDEYYDALWKGSNQGYRTLNHGVCSGLIVLQALTFYHELRCGFDLLDWVKFDEKQRDNENYHINCISEQIYYATKKQILEEYVPREMSIRQAFKPELWFKKLLWATASIAIHDLIQAKYYEKICKKHNKEKNERIDLCEDPLAFLGVLVDILQEWERYTISGESAFSEKTEQLQSGDVDIDIQSNKINFYYPPAKSEEGKDFLKDIETTLDRCLSKWNSIIRIGNKFLCELYSFLVYDLEKEAV